VRASGFISFGAVESGMVVITSEAGVKERATPNPKQARRFVE